MCENCVLHGEGTKWYLNPKNYGEKQYTEKEIHRMMGHWLAFWQFHQTMYERMRKYGAIHCMQVIPLEELFKVLDLHGHLPPGFENGYRRGWDPVLPPRWSG